MPEETFETPQPTQPTEQKSTDWTKIILAAISGLVLLAGSTYAGYWYGTQQAQQVEKPTPTPEPTTIPVVGDETEGWKTYTNSEVGYRVRYPEDASIDEDAGHPKPEELVGKKTCVHIKWGLGYVAISSPENEKFNVNCLRTGVGYDVKSVQDTLEIGGKVYKSDGWEVLGPGETLNFHNEFYRITLEDGVVIEYGSALTESSTFEDYLSKKDYITSMVESFQPIEPR